MPLELLTLVGGELIGGDVPVDVETRSAVLWPYSSDSLWNTPKGQGVSLGTSSHAMAVTLRTVVGQVNYSQFSTPINRAISSNPPVTIQEVAAGTWRPNLQSHVVPHAPVSITLAGDMTAATITYNANNAITFSNIPDGFMAIVDEGALTVTEAYKCCWDNQGSTGRTLIARENTVNTFDLTGRGDPDTQVGSRASKFGFTAGLIRSWEMTLAATDPQNAIRHALVMAVNNSQLLRPNTDTGSITPGYQWPAKGFDSNANTAYTGNIRMGTQFMLNPAFNIQTAGLSNEGIALAYALRDYGAYVGDRSTFVSLYAEQLTNGTAAGRMKTDWQNTLLAQMLPVLNNNSSDVGGPGARVRPLAPIFE